jgi:hypothetical protein
MIGYSKTGQVGPTKVSQVSKNTQHNRLLDIEYQKRGIDYCEVQIAPDCLKHEKYSFGELLKLTYAHMWKRIKYRACPDLLHSFDHTVRACIPCHTIMESSPRITRAVFMRLRGKFSVASK